MGFLDRLKEGLAKTRKGFIGKVEALFTGRKIDEETLEELEETLITSDIGVKATGEIVEFLRDKAKQGEIQNTENVREFLKQEMMTLLGPSQPLIISGERPFVDRANGKAKDVEINRLPAINRGGGC